MGQIEDLNLFTTIVEQGSISRAAEQINIAKSAVSRRLGLLEQRYGARLINRAPGQWEITATGLELYQRAANVVSEVAEIEGDFTETNQSLVGPLTISVPREFGLSYLSPLLMGFKMSYPDIQLMVDFDDHRVDLSRANYDFAIRIASNIGPDMVARQIGISEHFLFASPDYLAKHGKPQTLDDLKHHDLLQYGASRRSNWVFHDHAGKSHDFDFQPSLNSNSGTFLLDAALKGLGIARLPDFICQDAISKGDLTPIMTNFKSLELGIYLVHSQGRRFNRRMRLFAQELESACTIAHNLVRQNT